MLRPNIRKLQERLVGKTLGHGIFKGELLGKILVEGLINQYNYFCVGDGWYKEPETPGSAQVHLMVDPELAARTYIDLEGLVGDNLSVHDEGPFYSVESYVAKNGLEAFYDLVEKYMAECDPDDDFEDPTNPSNYNLVVIGKVSANMLELKGKR